MKIEFNSSRINSDVIRELYEAKKYLQEAIDHLYSQNYPSGFILSYVNNPLGECYQHRQTIDSILNWLSDSERQISNAISDIESNLTRIRGCEVKRINSSIK